MSLIKGSVLALSLKVAAAMLSFIVAASITRNVGTEVAGLYFFATSLVILFVSVCGLGLNNAVLKYVAIFNNQRDNHKLNAIVNKSILWCTLFGLSFIVLAFLILLLFPNSSTSDYHYYVIFILSVPCLCIIAILSHAIQAKGNIAASMLTAGLIQSFSFLLINLFVQPASITSLALCYLASVLLALLCAIIYWCYNNPFKFTIDFDSKVLLATCSSLLVFQIFQQFNTVIGQLFLGVWGSNTQIALYSVSIKVASLTGFIMFAVNRVVAPKFASLYAEKNFDDLEQVVIQSKQIMLVATLPLISILLIFPEFVLSFFGEEYKSSATVLRVLAIIQLFSVWVGSVSYLLIMTGQEKTHRNNVMLATAIAIILGLIIVPYFSLWGAVFVSGLCVIITCYLSSKAVKKTLNINMFSLGKFDFKGFL